MNNRAFYKYSFIGSVLCNYVRGAWSERLAIQHVKELKNTVQQYDLPEFSVLLLLDDWELSTPETVAVVSELSIWFAENGVQKTALVFEQDPLKKFQIDKMMNRKDEDHLQYFEKSLEAVEWLSQSGFTIDIDSVDAFLESTV